MVRAAPTPLALQRNAILIALLVLAGTAWAILFWQAAAMGDMAMGPTMGMAAPLFLAIWIVMMVAMMFPTAAPMILTFHQVQAGKRARGESFVSTWVFVGAYLAIWTAFGVLAYIVAVAAEGLAQMAMWPMDLVARIGGALLIAAGLYQLSPLKGICLSKCRTPLTFVMTAWRDGVGGAVRMGLAHGLYCLGCCWLLFVILFPLGVMNVAAMAVITLLIFGEKSLPRGQRIAQVAALALVLYGALVLVVPRALPTAMMDSGTAMPAMNMDPGMAQPDMPMDLEMAPADLAPADNMPADMPGMAMPTMMPGMNMPGMSRPGMSMPGM